MESPPRERVFGIINTASVAMWAGDADQGWAQPQTEGEKTLLETKSSQTFGSVGCHSRKGVSVHVVRSEKCQCEPPPSTHTWPWPNIYSAISLKTGWSAALIAPFRWISTCLPSWCVW